MMRITQDLDYDTPPINGKKLVTDLKEFNETEKFRYGIDWQWQFFWAEMTDEQCLMFCLKCPEYQQRFNKVKETND